MRLLPTNIITIVAFIALVLIKGVPAPPIPRGPYFFNISVTPGKTPPSILYYEETGYPVIICVWNGASYDVPELQIDFRHLSDGSPVTTSDVEVKDIKMQHVNSGWSSTLMTCSGSSPMACPSFIYPQQVVGATVLGLYYGTFEATWLDPDYSHPLVLDVRDEYPYSTTPSATISSTPAPQVVPPTSTRTSTPPIVVPPTLTPTPSATQSATQPPTVTPTLSQVCIGVSSAHRIIISDGHFIPASHGLGDAHSLILCHSAAICHVNGFLGIFI